MWKALADRAAIGGKDGQCWEVIILRGLSRASRWYAALDEPIILHCFVQATTPTPSQYRQGFGPSPHASPRHTGIRAPLLASLQVAVRVKVQRLSRDLHTAEEEFSRNPR